LVLVRVVRSLAEAPREKRGLGMVTDVRSIVRDGAKYWWLPLITGIAWLISHIMLTFGIRRLGHEPSN
jgi:hypothetical protein